MGVSATQVFSTAGLPAARRIELWEGHNAAALIGLSCHSTVPLEATEVNVPLGRWFRDEDGTRELRPGQLLICDADRPFARGFARGLEELAIKVPREALALIKGPVVTAFAPGRDPRGRPDGGPARRRVRLHRGSPGRPRAGGSADRGRDRGQRAPSFAGARGGGTTVPRLVRSRRLERAYAILAGPGPAGPSLAPSVAGVAARCGFTSAAYFSHAFRERFGIRAGEVRRAVG
jgi:Helix-turn-helix domain